MLRLLCICMTFCVAAATGAVAQVAPTPAEIAQYDGLHAAAHGGDVGAIRELLADGADVNARDRSGRTPAHVAGFASQDTALRALAAGGADMNVLEAGLYDVVTIAAVADDPELVALALTLGGRADLITSIYDGTALIAAAHLGHDEVVRILAENGAPLDHVNNLGWTALIEAVVLGDGGPRHQRTVEILLKAGADRTIPDRGGTTPLLHAERRGYVRIAELLRAAP